MKREDVRIRTEGALDAAELALTRVERGLAAVDWISFVRAQEQPPDRIDDAVAQVVRVDAAIGAELERRLAAASELARKRLREVGVEPTATRLDDLVAQLVARARVAEPARREPLRFVPWIIIGIAVIGLAMAWRDVAVPMVGLVLFVVGLLWWSRRR